METVLIGTAALAGVASILSPCVLPLLPGVMAYSTEKSKITPLAIVLGLTISFTVMGIASAMLGSILFSYMDLIKIISGAMILVMGLYMLSQTVEHFLLGVWQRFPLARTHLPGSDEGGVVGGITLGVSLGVVWIPCIGPILASILLIVAQQGTMWYGAVLLLAYSMGLGVPMLVIAYSSNLLSGTVRSLSHHTQVIRRIAGVILIIMGIYYIAGVFGVNFGF
ncbi:MAG TPA: cytochrome c biogenesis CcdA family protein [Methanocella sp.]|nr:cytochrome c biogenesis CcdA family protein [Methanocella sp.]